jgi:hypothetical protein
MTTVSVAGGVPHHSGLAVSVIDCPASHAETWYGPADSAMVSSYAPGSKLKPVFQNSAALASAAGSPASVAAMMSSTPPLASTMCAGRNEPYCAA